MGLGSDSLPVHVELGGVNTYLADSMQFMLELACRLTGRDCYYIMPSFRGEACDETHLSQFFHSEAEIRGDLADVMAVVDEYILHLAGGLLDRHEELLVDLAGGALRRISSRSDCCGSICGTTFTAAASETLPVPMTCNFCPGVSR
jgi:asparaginyl-tRNA synthetase